MQILAVSHESAPGLQVGFNYFGIEFWAQTEGYRHEASEEFLSREIDAEFN